MFISFDKQLLCPAIFFVCRIIMFIPRVWSMSWQHSIPTFVCAILLEERVCAMYINMMWLTHPSTRFIAPANYSLYAPAYNATTDSSVYARGCL